MAASGEKNSSIKNEWQCETDVDAVPFSFMWTIYDFSLHNKKLVEYLKSSYFSVVGRQKQIELRLSISFYPKSKKFYGDDEVYLAVYLETNSDCLFESKTKFRIAILDAKNKEKITSKHTNMIKTEYSRGWTQFIKRKELMDEDNKLLPDDTLTLFCTGSVVLEDTVHTSEKSDFVQPFKVPKCTALCAIGHLLESREFSDVTISAGNEEIQAHKVILSAHSTVFSAMFNCEMEEAKENRVEITDLEPDVVKEMLRFIYTGSAPNLKEMACDLIIAADKYNLNRLKAMCAEELFNTLTTDNAAEILILADRHGEEQLKLQTITFINTYLKHVINTTGYKTMIDSQPHLAKDILCASVTMQKNSGCDSHVVFSQRNMM